MRVLGIETSCDETAVAIYDAEKGLLSHTVYSQIELHREYGGVVPELASRDHIQKTLPMIQQTLQKLDLQTNDIHGIAYTAGPGLVGALLVGATIGRSLGWAWKLPTVGVHHLEAHLLAVFLEEEVPEFPFIALLLSGGHTLMVQVDGIGQYRLLGETLDDAVGEAFDKTAKLLGLPYPGGAALAELATRGNPDRFYFPRPMTDRSGLDFSFSGLKTFALNTLQSEGDDLATKADIARAFEEAVVETMIIKCQRALKATGLTSLVMAGGVAANLRLREALNTLSNVHVFFPRPLFCTDNAAMVAYTGYRRLSLGHSEEGLAIKVRPRWPIDSLEAI